MSKTRHDLNDEHMQMLEWCGTLTGIAHPAPVTSKRTHAWHASCSALAVLTSMLILNGCDSKNPVGQASEQVDQAAPDMNSDTGPLFDGNATVAPEVAPEVAPGLAPEPVGTQDSATDPASAADGPASDDLQKQ